MKIKYLILFFGILFRINAYSQEIKVTSSNKSLSQVLIEIRDKYDVEFSFDDTELSKYKISVKKSFKGVDKTLEYLLKDLPFEFEKVSGVYIIFPKKTEIKTEEIKPKVYSISGKIMEFKTEEYLPYSQLIVNSFGILSDQNGYFTFSSTKDSIFNIKISQLGYLIEDTTIYSDNKKINIYLTPADQLISQITVQENLIETFLNIGNQPATIQLNHKVTKYLPGSSDNSVFNLLRLQPGVLASGEQTNDIIVWGSYTGQSRVIFDGFTVFGLKNFNDNISAINPLIVKNIQLKKAGYDASYGDCVGAIVDISGKDGNNQKAHFNLGINNFTVNSLLEIPILKKTSLQLAYRQTYFNLYKEGFNLFPRSDIAALSDIYIYPDYAFRDYNIKYNVKTGNSIFYVSFLNSNDDFNYSFNKTRQYRDIIKTTDEKNHQTGLSVYYETKISDKLKSNLSISNSSLTNELKDHYDISSTITGRLVNQKEFVTNNEIRETKADLKTIYQTKTNHTLELNLQAINNMSFVSEDSSAVRLMETKNSDTYYTAGIKDIINFSNISFDIGCRYNYLPYINKSFFEPRISFSHSITDKLRYNLACGIYRQYLVKSSVVDDLSNYRYIWTVADEKSVPTLNSNHFVGGFSYNGKDFSFNVEPFYKTTYGLTRYIRITSANKGVYYGNAKSYGADFYVKYNFKKHTIWLSYTLSKTLEHFSYFRINEYLYAPQDQRHEVKLATIINLDPFFISANYVYGTGFLEKPFLQRISSNRLPYSRLDIAATFKFIKKKNLGECGISILNVLNTQNQKYSNFERVPVSQINSVNIYFEAVPFTPTLFLKLNI